MTQIAKLSGHLLRWVDFGHIMCNECPTRQRTVLQDRHLEGSLMWSGWVWSSEVSAEIPARVMAKSDSKFVNQNSCGQVELCEASTRSNRNSLAR